MRLGPAWVGNQLLGDGVGHHVIVIPELHNIGIVEARQDRIRRPFPVSWEDRLPNHKYLQAGILDSVEQCFGCGGPPQTHGSRGR